MVYMPSEDENRQMLDNSRHDRAKKGLEAQAGRISEIERWALDLQTDLAKAGILVLRPIILAD